MIIEEIKNIDSSETALKKFGFTMAAVSLIIGGLLFYYNDSAAVYFFSITTLLAISSFVAPIALKPLNFLWMSIAVVLGFIMTRIILGILFYLVITPIGLIAKLAGKDFIDKKIDKSKTSYWNYRTRQKFSKEIYERQF